MTEAEREQLDELLSYWIDEGTRHGAFGWGYVSGLALEMLEKKKYSKLPLPDFIEALKQLLQKDVCEYGDLLHEQVVEALED
jgi:hypothetical protein